MSATAHRANVRFAADASHLACVASDVAGGHAVEHWTLGPAGPTLRRRSPVAGGIRSTLPLPLPGGDLLISSYGTGGMCHEILTGGPEVRRLRSDHMRMASAPTGSSALALGIATGPDGTTAVHRITAHAVEAAPIATMRGALQGIRATSTLAVLTLNRGDTTVTVTLDVDTGEATERIWPGELAGGVVLDTTGDRLLLALPTRTGGHRLAVAGLDGTARLLPSVSDLGGPVAPLALSPDGDRIALAVTRGAGSGLAVVDVASGAVREADTGPGSLVPVGCWSATGLWLVGSTPTRPPGVGRLVDGAVAVSWAEPSRGGPDARIEHLEGPAGPIETLAYGPDWRSASRVLVTLHGGPRDHWRLGFEPLLRTFADAGIAVLAPNQRGSTGYGTVHEQAIVGAWGGPDLEDICAIGAILRGARSPALPRPALFGTSYGAYLALLAAAAVPQGWSHCAAVAPFLSAARLHPDAGTAVRALIDRADGRRPVVDALGERDLVRLAPAIRCPVFVAHGALDTTIPVAHSRDLVAAIDRAATVAGRPGPVHVEVADRGHDAFGETTDDPVMAALLRFLTTEHEGR